MTQLIEFKNQNKETLRGLFDEAPNKKGLIFAHGFERTTIEAKFKNVVDKLKGEINLFRFDFSGCGLSDGSFEDMTVEKSVFELAEAIKEINKRGIKEISLIGHSLSGCIILEYLKKELSPIKRVVLLAPALNQKKLLRYWFVKSKMKKEGTEITWDNFKDYLQEREFDDYINIKKRMTSEHELSSGYFLHNKDRDFQEFFNEISLDHNNLLVVHGDSDDKVPIQSNDSIPGGVELIVAPGGDHDLQRVDVVSSYLDKITNFIKN